jgi:hypothetical protein
MTTSADRADSPEKVADAGGETSAPAGNVYDWCHPGQHYSHYAMPVRHIEQGSGPGYTINACPTHQKARGLKPLMPVHAPVT